MTAPDRKMLLNALECSKLNEVKHEILNMLDEKYANPRHGHFKDWQNSFDSLLNVKSSRTDLGLDTITFGDSKDVSSEQKALLASQLKELCPWRKGPFSVFGIHIDTEWRSDWKWSRISPHVQLKDKLVLDIGCGNGYYALRMQAMGAKLVLGVDPSWHYIFQFHALQKYSSLQQKTFVLPFSFEELPEKIPSFDTIFSMGVLYHRQEPQVHLEQVYSKLAKKGQFVLETLIIDDEDADVLIPNERYANMRNVWLLPSIELLKTWLTEAGFVSIQVVDTTMTTVEEQRQTAWMTRYSLAQALNPDDHNRTIEGYPAPLRTTIIASK
jgi:tRNA (mo5U34)-methyltransferase